MPPLSGRFDGFYLVSSDSDSTQLAARLRETGLTIYGFGERKTPKPFVPACDKFIYVENLARAKNPEPLAETALPSRSPIVTTQLTDDTNLLALLRNAVEAEIDHEG
ncbi:NYN domain-containing protein [Amycolatopsis sp. cmx-11-51]|uniref:NYN domain-containing protein n=1 Tax=unclassified Amycolatopsis TaxID=2618356 RepID=UPI0039E61FD6